MKSVEQHDVSVHAIESTEIDFHKYWLILRRHWLPALGSFGAVFALSIFGASLQKPIYQSEGKLLFKPNEISSLTGLGTRTKDFTPLTEDGNPLKTEIEVILSKPLLRKTIATLNLRDEKGKLKSETLVRSQLAVSNVGATDVLQVSYQSTSPEEAAPIINQLMNLYLENNILTNRSEATAAREFISQQLPKTETAVRRAEEDLRRFKEKYQVVALAQEASSAVEIVTSLDKQITETQARLADANARSAALRDRVGLDSEQAMAESSLSQSPAVQKALEGLQSVESQLAVERTRYEEAHPVVVELKKREAALRAVLEGRVGQVLGGQNQPSMNLQSGELKQQLTQELIRSESERSGLTNQVATLFDKQSIYRQRLGSLPRLEQDQRELQRRVEAAQATYETLLKNLKEVQVAENLTIGNARIIEEAENPLAPSTSKKARFMVAAGFLLGVLLAAATIFVLEIRDRSVKTVREARELFGYTLLGAVPLFGKYRKGIAHDKDSEQGMPKVPVRDNPRSAISEVYRMLQANLRFLSSDKELKVIAVASSVPKEGKSTVSANLAAAMAQLGRRVLLVDADMRDPSQHHIWELTNEVGLSNILVGQAELETALKEVMPNLNILTSGVIPPNPVALLDSHRMALLIQSFSRNYDFIIIDTPPVALAADALVLGKMIDGILFVTRPGIIDSANAISAKETLDQSCQNVLGLVINGVIPQNEPDSYFYFAKDQYEEDCAPQQEVVVSER